MQTFEDFGRWVGKMGGQEGLKATYERELGKKVSQSAISGWFKNRKIPEPRRSDLKALGWRGPWEWPKEPEKLEAPGESLYVTEASFEAWRKYWREGEERILNRLKTLEDQVQKLRQQAGSE